MKRSYSIFRNVIFNAECFITLNVIIMSRKIAIAIIIILSIVAVTYTTTEANSIIQSITPTVELGPEIIVADLGYNPDGLEIRGQAAHYNGEHVIIIDDAEINQARC